jgi:multiple antibiotic resistance protein
MPHAAKLVGYIVAMLAITNPFGTVGVFIALTDDRSHREQRRIGITAAFACLIIFMVVTWFGEALLKLMGISVSAFQVGGGIVVAIIGLSMLRTESSSIRQTEQEQKAATHKASIAVVPLAIPILAGPGAISNILVDLHQFSTVIAKVYMSVANIFIAAVIGIVLLFAGTIRRILGVTGINILVRIMGLLLLAMAVQMMAKGAVALMPGLGH